MGTSRLCFQSVSCAGGFPIGAQRDFCRTWPNQQIVTVKGAHFVQEEAPDAVGEATARFVAKVLAGQISRAAQWASPRPLLTASDQARR